MNSRKIEGITELSFKIKKKSRYENIMTKRCIRIIKCKINEVKEEGRKEEKSK